MAFNYDKNKHAHGAGDSFWTSYSDLFLGLSSIFLLLYVTASLRTGTGAMQSQVENQKLTMKVEELQNQLKMYESVKNEYLETAPKDEQQEYQELMDKLVLLQDEAKNEKNRLTLEAKENAQKAQALNKYQQMIRNIMNANKVAKTRIATRDTIITDQDTEIDKQKEDIQSLESDVAQKKQLIEESKQKIAQTENALSQKMNALKQAWKHNKMTKAAYQKQVRAVQEANEKKLQQLETTKAQYSQQLNATNAKLNEMNQALASTQNQLASTQGELVKTGAELQKTGAELQKKGAEVKGLADKLAAKAGEAEGLKGQIGALKSQFEADKARERGAFEAQLAREKLSGAQRAAREAAFRAAAEGKAAAMGQKLAGLEGQLHDTEGALAKAKEEMDARKQIARDMQKSFAAAGVKADIDMNTGEVVLDFGDAYFESGSAKLKPQMTEVLEKAMPAYSKSLFGNPKIASKISTVEVVGFASPTYKGKYIDPNSTAPEDKAALKYNMDLSYQRANAIFQHLIDEKSNQFAHQQDLLPLMKVSGRSFLEVMNIQNRNVANAAEFCRLNDCKKAQRVIIRFSMDGKKR